MIIIFQTIIADALAIRRPAGKKSWDLSRLDGCSHASTQAASHACSVPVKFSPGFNHISRCTHPQSYQLASAGCSIVRSGGHDKISPPGAELFFIKKSMRSGLQFTSGQFKATRVPTVAHRKNADSPCESNMNKPAGGHG